MPYGLIGTVRNESLLSVPPFLHSYLLPSSSLPHFFLLPFLLPPFLSPFLSPFLLFSIRVFLPRLISLCHQHIAPLLSHKVNGTLVELLDDVKYLLSPQDLMAIDFVPELVVAGTYEIRQPQHNTP